MRNLFNLKFERFMSPLPYVGRGSPSMWLPTRHAIGNPWAMRKRKKERKKKGTAGQ
jgi:hypothetical protein